MEKLFLLALAIGFAGFIPDVHPLGESKLKSLVSIITHTSFAFTLDGRHHFFSFALAVL